MAHFQITEELLSQIENLQMLLKNNVAGMFGGNHKSRTYGSSCEFADYRDYVPGDDLRRIDWNLAGRFDKYYIKRFIMEATPKKNTFVDEHKDSGMTLLTKLSEAVTINTL